MRNIKLFWLILIIGFALSSFTGCENGLGGGSPFEGRWSPSILDEFEFRGNSVKWRMGPNIVSEGTFTYSGDTIKGNITFSWDIEWVWLETGSYEFVHADRFIFTYPSGVQTGFNRISR